MDMQSLTPTSDDPHGYNNYFRFVQAKLHKPTRHIPIRPVAPRLPDIKWTEYDDNALLASPSLIITGKSKMACTRRLNILRLEAAKRERAYESFTLFPKLPLEIQTMIWALAAAEPRVVEVHSVSLTAEMEPKHPNFTSRIIVCSHFRSRTFDPPLLSTCALSRSVALKSRFCSKRDLSHAVFNDGVYFTVSHDTAFLSAKTIEQWFIKASRTFYRKKWNVQERLCFPTTYPGPKLRCELRTLALDASFFLARGGPCVKSNGADVLRQRVGSCHAPPLSVWSQVWSEIKSTFWGVRTLILVLGDDFPEALGERCFGAMRLEEVVEGPEKAELEALRNKLGEWKNRDGINPIYVDVRLARVRSFGKNAE